MREENIDLNDTYLDSRCKDLLADAIKAYQEGRYSDTINDCDAIIRLDKNYSRAYHGKALALTQLGHFYAAMCEYEEIHNISQNARILKDVRETVIKYFTTKRASEVYQNEQRDNTRRLRTFIVENNLTLGDKFLEEKSFRAALAAFTYALSLDENNTLAKQKILQTMTKIYEFIANYSNDYVYLVNIQDLLGHLDDNSVADVADWMNREHPCDSNVLSLLYGDYYEHWRTEYEAEQEQKRLEALWEQQNAEAQTQSDQEYELSVYEEGQPIESFFNYSPGFDYYEGLWG